MCSCGKSETMAGTFNFSPESGGALHRIGHDCSGSMPWLGQVDDKAHPCGEFLRVVQRGSSNVYFPLTVSSIYLPLWGEDSSQPINKVLENPRVWDQLVAGLDDGNRVQAVRCEVVAGMHGLDAEELREAAQKKLDGTEPLDAVRLRSEEEFRRQEYDAFRTGRGGETTDLMVDVYDPIRYGPTLSEFLANVCLVRKLRETRVLVGFSRLLPVNDPGSTELLPIAEEKGLRWLPATVVYGEGIFLDFAPDVLKAWGQDPEVRSRVSVLKKHYNRQRIQRGLEEVEVTAKYVLLHTFAHAMIGQLSFDCGYGSASLRERIYCESDEPDRPMQGVLIYTASGDSEGTLGGLVRQGEPDRLSAIVERAILRAQWCSSDPVCIESAGQGSDNANLAACHGCVLLPETSCETGNRLLDRGLLVGTPDATGDRLFHQPTLTAVMSHAANLRHARHCPARTTIGCPLRPGSFREHDETLFEMVVAVDGRWGFEVYDQTVQCVHAGRADFRQRGSTAASRSHGVGQYHGRCAAASATKH